MRLRVVGLLRGDDSLNGNSMLDTRSTLATGWQLQLNLDTLTLHPTP